MKRFKVVNEDRIYHGKVMEAVSIGDEWIVLKGENGETPFYQPWELEEVKSAVKSVTVKRAEGPSHLCVTRKFDSFHSANEWIRSVEDTFPKRGYDKHDYVIEWENGEEYNGRLDTVHPENEYYTMTRNYVNYEAISYLKWLVENDENYAKLAGEMLETLDWETGE